MTDTTNEELSATTTREQHIAQMTKECAIAKLSAEQVHQIIAGPLGEEAASLVVDTFTDAFTNFILHLERLLSITPEERERIQDDADAQIATWMLEREMQGEEVH